MLKDTLNSISPLDGRYAAKVAELEKYFSEFALIKNRFIVEVKWLIFMSKNKSIPFVKPFSKKNEKTLENLIIDFSLKDAQAIKKIESKTNHDVKAVELYICKLLNDLNLSKYNEFVHFCCTS